MGKYTLDMKKYQQLARQAAAEGCVLLKNDNAVLPLRKGDKVSLFGRGFFNYYKSGLGSGGLVNTRYVVGIMDALSEEKDIKLNENLIAIYTSWIKDHPYDEGQGWGQVPWSQEEMPLTDEIVSKAAAASDVALVVIARTAGEDQDSGCTQGSYLLTDIERDMIAKTVRYFKRTAVLLNVGNIIDMKWVEEFDPGAVMYVWQGGQEGGHGVADVLTGRVNPCGGLTDTIAVNIEDYPAAANFGDALRNFYKEDIYVGYRYFETFNKASVLYPFGYGCSYTSFETSVRLSDVTPEAVTLTALVTNTGDVTGKEIVQVYIQPPQGELGKPVRTLAAFEKTGLISPGESTKVIFEIPKYVFASYDDSGVTGHKSCYVLEAGNYGIFVGRDVRSAKCAGVFELETEVVSVCQEACAPVMTFDRLHAKTDEVSGQESAFTSAYETVPTRSVDPYERMKLSREEVKPYAGDLGIKLGDVFDQKVSLDDFCTQLSDEDLIHMFRGEGMCSPKVTPGTGGAFGGLTDRLKDFGIPAACCSDGPSGIRMDCGTFAFSLPNGTLLGCTFDTTLVKDLYEMLGLELRKNRIDALLGPGLNIHRHPLNGRNFEYISEDPLLTGKMGAAMIAGMNISGSTGTIKHFCANNQETHRNDVDSVVSERALREIYLKGFEIAVKEGHARSVMTTYGALNGIWTAGNYDLVTTILRGEWGFEGIVMTDWWAKGNVEGEEGSRYVHAPMILAQNDLFMVTKDCTDMAQDDVYAQYEAGVITRSDLVRNAKNILGFILKSPNMLHELGRISKDELEEMQPQEDDISAVDMGHYASVGDELVIPGVDLNCARGKSDVCAIAIEEFGFYTMTLTLSSELDEMAQLPVSIYYDNQLKGSVSIQGTKGERVTETMDMGVIFGNNHYLKFFYGANGLTIHRVVLKKTGDLPFRP